MRAIAAEAGVSVETVNGHGPKGDLLFAAFELAFAGREGEAPFAETEAAQPALAASGPAEFTAAGVHVLMDAFARSEGIWRALTAAADVDAAVAARLEGMLARRRDEFAAWAGELAARGLRTADPEWDIDVLIGLVNHEAYRQFVVDVTWRLSGFNIPAPKTLQDPPNPGRTAVAHSRVFLQGSLA